MKPINGCYCYKTKEAKGWAQFGGFSSVELAIKKFEEMGNYPYEKEWVDGLRPIILAIYKNGELEIIKRQ